MQNKDKILFIDDEKICHSLIDMIISNFTNYQLISAYSGVEAIKLAKRYSKDLRIILCDINIPDMDGYAIYNQLRGNISLLDTPFIFQTGLADQQAKLQKVIGHNIHTIFKPYDHRQLLQVIENANEFSLKYNLS